MVETLAQRSLRAIWHPCTQMWQADRDPPLAVARAQGPWLELDDGSRLFDGISSWWVNLLGHGHPRVVEALKDQLDTLSHVMLAGCTHEPAVALAEALHDLSHGHLGHCFFASDGASAVEIALKMSAHSMHARGQSGRNRFVCLTQSYHGETLGALSVTDVPIFRESYAALIREPLLVPSPDPRQAPAGMSEEVWAEQAARVLERTLESHGASICALILEPLVQGAAGMAIYPPAYLRRARALTRAHGVHLIADEIAVGCGRTGTFFASEQSLPAAACAADWPDFICLSKGISGGFLPLSLVLTQDEVYQAFYHPQIQRGFLHSHSYSGNPLACRAALTVLQVLRDEQLLEKTARAAQALTSALYLALSPALKAGALRHFRTIGSIWAVDISPSHLGQDCTRRIRDTARAKGLLLRPIGPTVYLMPPFVLHEGHVEWLSDTFTESILENLGHHASGSTPPTLA
ncbi:BioA Adenosylmethionine-8-amino-7-oxononanoate aminotransferase [Burkholderiales bacterium]